MENHFELPLILLTFYVTTPGRALVLARFDGLFSSLIKDLTTMLFKSAFAPAAPSKLNHILLYILM